MDQDFATPDRERSARTITTVVYALQALAFLNGLTFIVAIIINYIKREDVRGTLAQSHFRWQIRTFWFSLLWLILGSIGSFFLIGYLILLVNGIWVIYRIVRGWLALNDGNPMYQ
ncbi:DUF4870 family protein [Dongshaea marina]|uniref:DUF4870 family protein n=1 Tax=Dongshaea marina TaxID=2047966 RepID=UPI000D3E02DE|nr:hypothetical protein [Dongshaea marina]